MFKQNSDVNDGSMRSKNRNIRTEKYLDAASEPGVVGSGSGWLHGAGILPDFRMSKKTFHHICQHFSPRRSRGGSGDPSP